MTSVRSRTLHDLIDDDAPLDPTRAATIMLAVTSALVRLDRPAVDPTVPLTTAPLLGPADISVAADGDVTISRISTGGDERSHPDGAAVGRILFSLVVGREPIDRSDAQMPRIVGSFSPEVCSLLGRSLSEVPAHWPSTRQWLAQLEEEVGPRAMDPPAAQVRRHRRRRRAVAVAVIAVVSLSATTVALAPSWWESVNSSAPTHARTAAQLPRASS